MMGQLDRIPKVGDEVDVPVNDHEVLRLRVEVMDGKRIAWIVMSRVTENVPRGCQASFMTHATPKSPSFRIACR